MHWGPERWWWWWTSRVSEWEWECAQSAAPATNSALWGSQSAASAAKSALNDSSPPLFMSPGVQDKSSSDFNTWFKTSVQDANKNMWFLSFVMCISVHNRISFDFLKQKKTQVFQATNFQAQLHGVYFTHLYIKGLQWHWTHSRPSCLRPSRSPILDPSSWGHG